MDDQLLKTQALKAFELVANCPPIGMMRKNKAIRRVGKRVKDTLFPRADRTHYGRWLRQELVRRSAIYAVDLEPGLLSFVSTVWNTPLEFLKPLAESLLRQRGGQSFEWIVLDNGSSDLETVEYLRKLGEDPRVKLLRVAENQGIIGGMRLCLEAATGRYIVPVDSDDLLYPDAAQILTCHLQRRGYPAVIFTDEDKLIEGDPTTPYFKPDWDPVLFANACYIAHLCAIDRQIALKVGVYTDRETNGSHDWDTFVRFVNAGHTPIHVPEVTYSWRVHPQSTAGNMSSKSYITSSQQTVLEKWLAPRNAAGHFQLEPSPLFSGTPDWWIRRRAEAPRPMSVVVFAEAMADAERAIESMKKQRDYPVERYLPITGGLAELRAEAAAFRSGTLVAMVDAEAKILRDGWGWEALGLFELFDDTAMVGGKITGPRDTILSAGAVLGFGETGCESPEKGRKASYHGYFANLLKQRSVSAVSTQLAVVDGAFLSEFLAAVDENVSARALSAWLGAFAKSTGRRVVFSPFLEASAKADWETEVAPDERARFLKRFGTFIPDYATYSSHLGLERKSANRPATPAELEQHLTNLFREKVSPRFSQGNSESDSK